MTDQEIIKILQENIEAKNKKLSDLEDNYYRLNLHANRQESIRQNILNDINGLWLGIDKLTNQEIISKVREIVCKYNRG